MLRRIPLEQVEKRSCDHIQTRRKVTASKVLTIFGIEIPGICPAKERKTKVDTESQTINKAVKKMLRFLQKPSKMTSEQIGETVNDMQKSILFLQKRRQKLLKGEAQKKGQAKLKSIKKKP